MDFYYDETYDDLDGCVPICCNCKYSNGIYKCKCTDRAIAIRNGKSTKDELGCCLFFEE